MPRIAEITGDDLKAQINEYHVLVAEVVGGMYAELTAQANRAEELEQRLSEIAEQVATLEHAQHLLLREVLSLRKASGVSPAAE